jgi:HlyD family secretion protein
MLGPDTYQARLKAKMKEPRDTPEASARKDGEGSRAGADLPVVLPRDERLPAPAQRLPAKIPSAWTERRWLRAAIMLGIAALGVGIGTYWWARRQPPLPPGIASGNGRLEADPIDIATKFAGRILELRVDEGEMVGAGQVLAVMDTRDLEASLKKSEAQVEQAQKAVSEANANVDQTHSQVIFAEQEMERAAALVDRGITTRETFDRRRQQLDGAKAAEIAAKARVILVEHALEAAQHDVELYKVNIADNTLVAPRDGRIEYRIANVGEVLPAGGRVFTMLDVSYVYMDIYLPTLDANRLRIGNDARILLDAFPYRSIPAKVSFIATQSQFTPKMVETQTEREKLMFRIRVRIDPERSRAHAYAVQIGLPGVAYVKYDPNTAWPERLHGRS